MASRMRKAWRINPDSPVTGSLPARLLASRGLLTPDAVTAFLHPSQQLFHDPFLLPDMAKACALIEQALKSNSRILVHGDYDVDGITATAILVRFFRSFNARVESMIPDRLTDGYGLTDTSVAAIIASGCDLLITVDCGISSLEEVDQLNQAGIPVIITDHHACKAMLPAAAAVINPKRADSQYPFSELAGVGVAFKLIQALSQRLNQADDWLSHLDLVALGTVADVVPLVDENRIIVRLGLDQLNQVSPTTSPITSSAANPAVSPTASPAASPTCGLSILLGLGSSADRVCTARTLGYSLAPRINASGRLGSADDALHLLLSDEPADAEAYARKLVEMNLQRQEIELAVTTAAIDEIDRFVDFDKPGFILAVHPDWHAGVIGIAASRLAEHYCRPVIILTGDDGQYRGSCRSWGSINMLEALEHASDTLVRYGGHAKAAGLTLDPERLDDFRHALDDYATRQIQPDSLQPVLPVDLTVAGTELTLEHARVINQMEPFGEGNPVPILVARGLVLRGCRAIGSNSQHLKMTLFDPDSGSKFDGIAFGSGDAADAHAVGDRLDVCFALEINQWQGRQSIQLRVVDLHQAETGDEFNDEPWIADHLYQNGSNLQALVERYQRPVQHFQPTEPEYKAVYRYLKKEIGEAVSWHDLSLLAARISRQVGIDLNAFRLARILSVFHETGLVSRQNSGIGQVRLRMLPVDHQVRLDQSETYRRLLLETGKEVRP